MLTSFGVTSDANSNSKPTRVAIPKMLRFEVFKRDGFACQYFCGVCWNKVREAA